jgi:hypothetical protein
MSRSPRSASNDKIAGIREGVIGFFYGLKPPESVPPNQAGTHCGHIIHAGAGAVNRIISALEIDSPHGDFTHSKPMPKSPRMLPSF